MGGGGGYLQRVVAARSLKLWKQQQQADLTFPGRIVERGTATRKNMKLAPRLTDQSWSADCKLAAL